MSKIKFWEDEKKVKLYKFENIVIEMKLLYIEDYTQD